MDSGRRLDLQFKALLGKAARFQPRQERTRLHDRSIVPRLSSPVLTLIPLPVALVARPRGVSENAVPGGGEEVAQLVVMQAGEPGLIRRGASRSDP